MSIAAPTYVDPGTDVTEGAETGLEPLAKNLSYYRRAWREGKPFSSEPSWSDLAHIPPSRRELVARPDLALAAMRRILKRVESELLDEAEAREKLRLRRENRLIAIRARHEARHEFQRKIGVKAFRTPNETGYRLEQRRQVQMAGIRMGLGESNSLPTLALVGDTDSAEEDAAADLEVSRSSLGGIKGARPAPINVPPMLAGGSSKRDPSSPSARSPGGRSAASSTSLHLGHSPGASRGGENSPARSSDRRASRVGRGGENSPLLSMRAGQVEGLSGLLIPRYNLRSRSPSPEQRDSVEQAIRTPPPRSPPPLLDPKGVAAEANAVAALHAEDAPLVAPAPTPIARPNSIHPLASRSTPAERAAAVGSTLHRSYSAGLLRGGGAGSGGLLVPAPVGGTVATAIASLAGAGVKSTAPLLGWAESHGQCLGKPKRRMPQHFEAGLARHDQPINPRPTHKPAAMGIHTNESQIDLNMKARQVGDGGMAYELSPGVGRLVPQRWTPARTTESYVRAVGGGSAPSSPGAGSLQWGDSPGAATLSSDGSWPPALPPSPLSLARAARALSG